MLSMNRKQEDESRAARCILIAQAEGVTGTDAIEQRAVELMVLDHEQLEGKEREMGLRSNGSHA
jgi:hypothetical protein